MKFIIDANAGPCPGVKRAISLAENELQNGPLYSVGPLINNSHEVRRLEENGLKTVSQDAMQAGELD